MTNLPCEVVRDLLPSYVDGLTSETTGALVEAHVEGCDACRAVLQAMRAPEAEPEKQENEVKEIDFLKKNKKRNRKVLLGSLLGAAALVCLVLFVRFFVIGQELYGMQMLSEVDVQNERLTMELSSLNEALVVSEAKLEESNGVVTLHAKGVYRSFLHRGSYPVIYTASEPIRQVRTEDRILWDDGAPISPLSSNVFATRHDYVGDMSANNRTASALNLPGYFGNYSNELHTSEQPYDWTILLQQDIPADRLARREKEMVSFACVMLAMTGNLDQVSYRYTVDGAEQVMTVTANDASEFFGGDIKDCGTSARLLDVLLQKTGLNEYAMGSGAYADAEDAISVEVVNGTDEPILAVSIDVYRNGKLCTTQGGMNADESTQKKGDVLAFGFTHQDFGSWDPDTELTLCFSVQMASGKWYEIPGELRAAAGSGTVTRVIIGGSAADGFTISQ